MISDYLKLDATNQMATLELAQKCLTLIRQNQLAKVTELLEIQMDYGVCALWYFVANSDPVTKAAALATLKKVKEYRTQHPRMEEARFVDILETGDTELENHMVKCRQQAIQILNSI